MKRSRPYLKHSLSAGNTLVRAHDQNTHVAIGLPGGGRLELDVTTTGKRDVVQVHLKAFDPWGEPLPDVPGGIFGGPTVTLAWAWLDTRTGTMYQGDEP